MLTTSLHNQWHNLLRELSRCSYLLKKLQRTDVQYRKFSSWENAISYFKSIDWNDPISDGFILPIINSVKEKYDSHWHTIITALFWHFLLSVYSKRAKYEVDGQDELWQIIQWRFIESVHKLDLSDGKTRIAKRLFNMLKESVRYICEKQRNHALPITNLNNTAIEEIYMSEFPTSAENVSLGARLSLYAKCGFTTAYENELLTGLIEGSEDLSDFALRHGLTYETAKKSRQRALKKLFKLEYNLSPFTPVPPPLVFRRRTYERDTDNEDVY